MKDFRPVDAKALTNLFLDWAEIDVIAISPMKLQKLIFFPHADFLAKFDVPLVKQEFEAWDYGPVLPYIYQEFKSTGAKPIQTRAKLFDPILSIASEPRAEFNSEIEQYIKDVYDFYKRLSAETLSDISHSYEGAWRQARSLFANGLNMNRRMSNELIKRFHKPIYG